jgi:hypothetical protein
MSSEGFDVEVSNIQIIVVLTTLVLMVGFSWLVAKPGSAATCAPASRI